MGKTGGSPRRPALLKSSSPKEVFSLRRRKAQMYWLKDSASSSNLKVLEALKKQGRGKREEERKEKVRGKKESKLMLRLPATHPSGSINKYFFADP